MNWVQIVLMVLSILRQLKKSSSADQFSASVQASYQLPAASGDFLKWLWENKEQIIELVKVIIGLFPAQPPASTMAVDEQLSEIQAGIAELKS